MCRESSSVSCREMRPSGKDTQCFIALNTYPPSGSSGSITIIPTQWFSKSADPLERWTCKDQRNDGSRPVVG